VLLHIKGDTVTLDTCLLAGSANGQTGFTGAVEIFGVGSSVVTGCNVTETLGAARPDAVHPEPRLPCAAATALLTNASHHYDALQLAVAAFLHRAPGPCATQLLLQRPH